MFSLTASLTADLGGRCEKLAISTASAATVNTYGNTTSSAGFYTLITSDSDCYFRSGLTPVALGTGVDMFLSGGNTYRVQHGPGIKFAFICLSGTGNVYMSPEQ